jgi:hypothetical protein
MRGVLPFKLLSKLPSKANSVPSHTDYTTERTRSYLKGVTLARAREAAKHVNDDGGWNGDWERVTGRSRQDAEGSRKANEIVECSVADKKGWQPPEERKRRKARNREGVDSKGEQASQGEGMQGALDRRPPLFSYGALGFENWTFDK